MIQGKFAFVNIRSATVAGSELLRFARKTRSQHVRTGALLWQRLQACQETVNSHLSLLGAEGKALGRDFIVRLIKSGVKPTISGDLWSDGGMGLFGIYAHGISESWVMEKALIGLVACETERHTAENITKWTKDALLGIGLKAGDLLEQDAGA